MSENDSKYNEACLAYEDKDYHKAYELFYELALESDVSCQVNVANMLMHGLGVEQNSDRANEWYEQAALNEDKEAQYIHGWNCIKNADEEEGYKYLNLSAEAGFVDAIYDLAGLYAAQKEMHKASVLYEKAALDGKKEALGPLFYSKKQVDGWFKTLIYMMKNISNFTKSVN